jgi:pSer/pThr/pTyr-binding forkhead associated (FHA) protein
MIIGLDQVDMSSQNTKHRFIIKQAYSEIGRDPECELVLPEELDHISARHVSLTVRMNKLYIDHIGRNHSFLNGIKITGTVKAEDGDILELTTEGPQFVIRIIEEKNKIMNGKNIGLTIFILICMVILIWILL